jgi:talin
MAQMLTAAAQGNELYTGIASKETLNSLRSFANSIRAICACSANNRNYQEKLIDSARIVLQQSVSLVNESKQALTYPNESVQNQQRLAQIARSIAQSLYECVNCLPGQKDIDEVIKSISEFSSVLFNSSSGPIKYPQTTKTLHQIQTDLNQSALSLNQATNQIVIDSRKGSQLLSQSTYRFSGAFGNFFQNGLTLAGQEQLVEQDRNEIIKTLKDVYTNSNKLLQSAKSCVADPNASSSRQQLAMAVKQVTESINSVVNICLETNNPILTAQKECDNALRDIETTRTVVQANNDRKYEDDNENDEDNFNSNLMIITEPPTLNGANYSTKLNTYYDCLDQIIDKSRLLGESMTGIANSCKNPTNPSIFAKSIKDTSVSICGLVETAAHSAYIIGISDIESKPGRAAILDTNHFINCSQHIQDTCTSLQSLILNLNQNDNDQKQHLIQAATQIAHSTANLCNACQMASSKTSNILAKRHFVQSAKQVANATAHFVKSIKTLDSTVNQKIELKQETYEMLVSPLLESVDSLCQYALSPEFAGYYYRFYIFRELS